ncbi:hypothetical protein NEOC95_002353 [Neochlamydia sp. AcF95]|nr:hypothetical protein [Neochlamydia sp. AcF95]
MGSSKKWRECCFTSKQIKYFRAYLKDPVIAKTNRIAAEGLRNVVMACKGGVLYCCIRTLHCQGKSIAGVLTVVLHVSIILDSP